MMFRNMSSRYVDMKDSYLGYSITDIKVGQTVYLVVGAPRYGHKGRVLVFLKTSENPTYHVDGDQSGCYFGAVLCTVNLRGRTGTILVLVGAPMYSTPETEGRVYVYRFDTQQGSLDHTGILSGQSGQSSSRFGTSIAEVADLNGDGIQDVAVGAPFENGGKGSVYIFNGGEQGLGQSSQRIAASDLPGTLQYWGQSLHGTMDLSGDGIPELAVGSQGKVLVLRSRPVIMVEPSVTFSPAIIRLDTDCMSSKNFIVKVCFTNTKVTKDNIGDLQVTISYNFTLDRTRSRFRAYVTPKNRQIQNTFTMGLKEKCFPHNFVIPECPEDSLVFLSNELEFSVTGLPSSASKLKPILDPRTQTKKFYQLDFEKQCGTDNKCIDELKVSFNFSGASELQVGITPVLNLTVSIQNSGENSYNTHVILTYPSALSYRRATLLQWDGRATVQCEGLDIKEGSAVHSSKCFISRPIFKSQAKVVFVATFDVDANSQVDRVVNISANATSGNEEHITTGSFALNSIPVRFGINILVKSAEDSTHYINFTSGSNDLRRPVHHTIQVENLGAREIPVSVTIRVPVKLVNTDIWSNTLGLKVPGCTVKTEDPTETDVLKKLKETQILNCSVAMCSVLSCSISVLKNRVPVIYNLTGEVSSAWLQQTQLESVRLVSSASLGFDTKQYIHRFTKSKTLINTEVQTHVEVIKVYDYKKEIIGGAAGGLLLLALITLGLYKAGFFKRGYKEMMEQQAGDADAGEDAAPPAEE
ncbi:ITAX protein, partial [Amia calva]|nr:ITAX protein [Amia calva]